MSTSETSTVVLRFRDLVTAPGGTIARHREDIAEHGYVWWGWWGKAGERVPQEVFGALAAAAQGGGLPVLLFDSGQLKLFRATCADIRWNATGKRELSPEPEATPEYYREEAYLAWLKLTHLDAEPVADPESVLREHAYVRVDEFFETRPSRYGRFYDKWVASPRELREQERTIWFLRPVRDTDDRNEILLLDSRTLDPTHFPGDFHSTGSTRLLWVSDLHFSTEERSHHGFPVDRSREDAAPLAARIEHACTQEHEIPGIGGLIVSGDLTWRADAAEYGQAREFVRKTTSWAGLGNYQVAVCPGNHDLPFSDQPWEKNTPIRRVIEDARDAYDEFYQELFYLRPNEFLSCGRRYLLGGAVPVEVVCLNSSFLEQKEGVFQGHGFLGEAQLDDAAKQMGWDGKTGEPLPVRVVVVHHHLLPVTYRESPVVGWTYSVVLDAEALARWVAKHRVRAVLHGHMHNPFHATVERPEEFGAGGGLRRFHVFGVGSAGVDAGHLGEIRENMFAVLDFSRTQLTVSYYTVHPVNPSRPLGAYTVPLWD